MDKVYRQALIAAVYGESATYHVADDPLAKDAANTVRRLREQLSAAIARAEAAERDNARLRESLEEIAKGGCDCVRVRRPPGFARYRCPPCIARAALHAQPGEEVGGD